VEIAILDGCSHFISTCFDVRSLLIAAVGTLAVALLFLSKFLTGTSIGVLAVFFSCLCCCRRALRTDFVLAMGVLPLYVSGRTDISRKSVDEVCVALSTETERVLSVLSSETSAVAASDATRRLSRAAAVAR